MHMRSMKISDLSKKYEKGRGFKTRSRLSSYLSVATMRKPKIFITSFGCVKLNQIGPEKKAEESERRT